MKVSDLVKNLITKSFKKKNKGVDIAKDQWGRCVETIETSTKDLNMDTFLLHFWLSKYDYTSQSKLFKKIKNHVDSHNVKDFLKEVELNSRIYREIREINFREWTNQEEDLKRSIKALIDFKVTQPIPMILSGFRDKFQKDITLKQLKELIKTIEHFHFLFTAITSKRSSGGISLMYSSLAKRFSNCSGKDSKNLIIKELKLKLKERRPSLEEFIAGFKELEFTSKRTKDKNIIRYVLRKLYEYDNKPTVTGTPIDFEKMTIEHLTPDSSGYDWKGKVGNLIFVGQELNDKLGTKKFIDKKKVLKKSNLFIDHEINRAKKWNRDTVNDRTEYMATKCYQVIFKM